MKINEVGEFQESVDKRPKNIPARKIVTAVILFSIVIVGLLSLKLAWATKETSKPSQNQQVNLANSAPQPTVHTVPLSDTLSETVYLSTAGSGSRIDWNMVEEDVPLITIINGSEQHYQPSRNSPDWKDLVLNNKILSIAWKVPAGYRGTVSYTISPK
jgi:hypothetical protein